MNFYKAISVRFSKNGVFYGMIYFDKRFQYNVVLDAAIAMAHEILKEATK